MGHNQIENENNDRVETSGFNSKTNLIECKTNWDRPLEFILSCMGYAIGLGNVWRFPYLCYRHGGGAFLIPYTIMLFLLGLPIFLIELAIGQYSKMGPVKSFQNIAPFFHGLGYCTLVVITFVTIYYMVIVAWTIFYIVASFSVQLDWATCDHDYNTKNCFSSIEENYCQEINTNSTENNITTIFWNQTCYSVENICQNHNLSMFNISTCFNINTGKKIPINDLISRIYASQEYFQDYVLGMQGATWYNFGYPQWKLVLCLLAAWIVAYVCLVNGIQTSGKAVYFTALFPYVVLFLLLIRGLTLDGAWEGLKFYITPDWSLLKKSGPWGDAASQIFYSFGIGCGSLITLASYNKFTNNIYHDALVVSAANAFTSILAGFCIFPVLGFLAHNLNLPVNEVVTSGPGLAFVAYPEAVLRMPWPQFWSVLFFFMMFILGLGSQFAGIETINTTIIDSWPQLRNQHWKIALCTCTICFLGGIPMCCNGGIYLFTLMDWNTASWSILLIGLAEVGAVVWCYGCNQFLNDLELMQIKLSKWSRIYWRIVLNICTPVCLLAVFIFLMSKYQSATFDDYIFPYWADVIGWLISISTLLPMPIFIIYQLAINRTCIQDLFKKTKKWIPADDTLLHLKTNDGVNNSNYGTMQEETIWFQK